MYHIQDVRACVYTCSYDQNTVEMFFIDSFSGFITAFVLTGHGFDIFVIVMHFLCVCATTVECGPGILV